MFSIKVAIAFCLNRLKEPSTWAGLSVGALAVAHSLQSHATLGAALIAGAVAVLLPEKK